MISNGITYGARKIEYHVLKKSGLLKVLFC